MSFPRFFIADLTGPTVQLPDAEARHARGSRRLSADDPVILFDGRGREASGRLADTGTRRVLVTIEKIVEQPRPRPALTLAFAPPKGPRQDALIEKCTELGVAAFLPLDTARSVASVSDHRRDKWQRTALEAAKQAGLAWLPEFRDLRSLSDLLANLAPFDLAVIALSSGDLTANHPTPASRASIPDLLPALRDASTVLALIGPEGGWTADEVRQTLAANVRPITLGPNVLRIETAAVAVAAAVHAVLHTSSGSQNP